VADVEVAVGFGREAGMDSRVALFGDMRRDDVADKIRGCRRVFFRLDSWFCHLKKS